MSIRSKTHHGKGYNELRFEDEKDQEEVFLQAEKDYHRLVKNNETAEIQNDQKIIVTNASEHKAKSITIEAQDFLEFNVGGTQIKLEPNNLVIKGLKTEIKGNAFVDIKSGLVKINTGSAGGGGSVVKINNDTKSAIQNTAQSITKSTPVLEAAEFSSEKFDGSGAIEPIFFPANMLGGFSPKNIVKSMSKKVFGDSDKAPSGKDDGIIGGKNRKPEKRQEITLEPGKKGDWNKDLNKDLMPNTDYKVGNKIYKTDELGRVKQIKGELIPLKKDRNTYQQGKAGQEDGIKDALKKDDGGHLIPSRHDGAGEQINYVPMDSNLNRGSWKKMENKWDDALKEGKKVEVDIKPIYKGASKRPDKFIVKYKIDGQFFKKKFKNTLGGK